MHPAAPRVAGCRPIAIRLALPPAAAVFTLTERSTTSRASSTAQSPGAMAATATIGPGRAGRRAPRPPRTAPARRREAAPRRAAAPRRGSTE
jgi:hypothetical protein